MKLKVYLWVVCILLTLCMCNAESHFKNCAEEQLSDDKPLQCKIKSLQVDGNMPKVKDYMTCAFEASGWMPKGSNKLDTSKIAEDMTPNGFSIKNNLDEVAKECEGEFGAEISAIDYLACLLIDEKTKKEFKMTLMIKEAEFFKQNLCN
uniref:Short form D7 salivary protein SD7-1 n=1 Tax=Aedes albopictus TaxID=7160 RepID=Q5MIT0_AEDAL|nr:short form D7 salivary protein SD7-1 [Aedes albopictus]